MFRIGSYFGFLCNSIKIQKKMNSNTDLSYQTIANTIRGLSMDAVQKANSGHPGLPMGMADVATVLWSDFLRFNPSNPDWFNRDRFVLSGGHGSMLLYSLLHLYGYDLSLDDLKNFRQMGSKTPGHPEVEMTPGVETTTGPLGQGLANAVGMAIAETHLAAKFKTNPGIIDHFTYVMAGDGDLQEGISHEACSLAGHLKLSKLILLYDSNDITIDGKTELSFTEDVNKRFVAYGWDVMEIDGHDYGQIHKAIEHAKAEQEKPSIIICKTIIGYGSPNKAGTSGVHGSPLGNEELLLTKQKLALPVDHPFYVPEAIEAMKEVNQKKGEKLENDWLKKLSQCKTNSEDQYNKLLELIDGNISAAQMDIPFFMAEGTMATRKSSGKILEYLTNGFENLIGGSADLTPSNNTMTSNHTAYSSSNPSGNYIYYGVREHAMGSIMNGIALHGGLIPYGGTFFVFSDYMRPAIRMAALMGLQVIYVFTHDSIGLGEDGPTHQPVEHLSSLRAMPNVQVLRPMDANETVVAWKQALEYQNGPSCLVLTRQNLPIMEMDKFPVQGARRGGYVLAEDAGFDRIISASGSEVELALAAKETLNEKGIKVRVVSMLSTELFDQQEKTYRADVLPENITNRLAIEAGATQSWYKYVGLKGQIIGMDRFGASAPEEQLFEKFGITAEHIVSCLS